MVSVDVKHHVYLLLLFQSRPEVTLVGCWDAKTDPRLTLSFSLRRSPEVTLLGDAKIKDPLFFVLM